MVCDVINCRWCAGLGWLAAYPAAASQHRIRGPAHAFHEALVTGTSGGNLEQILHDHIAEVRNTAQRLEELEALARQTDLASRRSLQWLGVLRFNPFDDVGGDQSFAVALVDGYGNGVVISSLHMRDVTRVYAKPLKKWEAEHHLTDEEKQAIANAYALQKQ